MKLYVITVNDSEDVWGCEYMLKGVYSTKEKAIERIRSLGWKKDIAHLIDEVELDKDIDVYIGGYTE